MKALSRIALAVLGVVMSGAAEAQTAPGELLLGHVHVWAKIGRVDLDDAAAREWGIDREGYLGLEVYFGQSGDLYFGGEIGHARAGRAISADGKRIRDFDFLWLEANGKKAFDLRHGLTIDAGLGSAIFYVDGEEVTPQDGQEFTDPLADVGLGLQVFADFNWRVRRLLIGLEAKYQWAFDLIDVDYSNFRIGGHIGMAF